MGMKKMFKILFFIILILVAGLYPFSILWGHNLYFGVLIGVYFILQIGFATKNYAEQKNARITNQPHVAILVVGHRENPEYWKKCIQSIKQSQYGRISAVCCFIDGNEPQDAYMDSIFKEEMKGSSLPWFSFLNQQGGKRSVMYKGFKFIKNHLPWNEYIIVMDSDTIIQKEGILNLVKCIHPNPKNGCATGNIQIFNKGSVLGKIIHARYGYAFTIERGAMSAVGVMNCCSGPFSIYRQSVLMDDLLEEFKDQTCCGKHVGPGDDRHLTLLCMKRGYLSRQTPFAIAETETPTSIHRYLQQQLRWMRSFYREMSWQVRCIPHQNPYLAVITVYELFFPFFIIISFLPTFGIWVHNDYHWSLLVQRIAIALGILILRTSLLSIFNSTQGLLNIWNLAVFPLYFTLLMPLKIYALFSFWHQSWMTSPRNKLLCSCNLDVGFMYLFLFLWLGILSILGCFYLSHLHLPTFKMSMDLRVNLGSWVSM